MRVLLFEAAQSGSASTSCQATPVRRRGGNLNSKRVKALFTENHDELCDALWKDLRRNVVDADLMDVMYNAKEADYALKHLDAWMKPERVHTPLVFEPGHVRVRRDPLGVTLIIGAWNEPFMLLFGPLVAAFAGGNTAVLKPSEVAVACSRPQPGWCPNISIPVPSPLWKAPYPKPPPCWQQKWDFIFFTGSPAIGKIVHQAAAKNLTPCVLELGGKNPTIVHSSANLKVAARRIAYGRFHQLRPHLHCARSRPGVARGQRCVRAAPDGDDPRVLRRRSETQPRLRPDDQPQELRSPRRAAGQRQSGRRRPDRSCDRYIAPTVLVDVSPGLADHAGRSLRPDPASARN